MPRSVISFNINFSKIVAEIVTPVPILTRVPQQTAAVSIPIGTSRQTPSPSTHSISSVSSVTSAANEGII